MVDGSTLFSVQANIPSLETEDAPPMAGYSGLSRVALVSLAKPRPEDEAWNGEEAAQKSEVTCRLVSKATPNVSHVRRICSRYIKLKSCGGKQATVVIQLKTSLWALANDLSKYSLLSGPHGHWQMPGDWFATYKRMSQCCEDFSLA